MNLQMGKKDILKKTAQAGSATFISRMLGITREFLFARFLGVGAISDAFLTAFKVPSFLRKIFAEGALSAASVPIFVKKVKEENKKGANSLMTTSFLFFEGLVFILCLLVFFYTEKVIKIVAPGFSQEQISHAIPFLQILFPMIFFISSAALLASALQAVNHFFIPAFAPALLNIAIVSALIVCLKYNLQPYWLCVGVLFGGSLVFLSHLVVYLKLNFSFGAFSWSEYHDFKSILKKFLFCLLGIGIVEINLFIDMIIGSFLPKGSVTLIHYGGRFMSIPLGIFAVSFSNVLLSQFSRVVLYAPSRLKFYLLEITKFVVLMVVPAALFLFFVSEEIFSIIMFGKKVGPEKIFIAKWILIIYCVGLVFFCLNKILLNIFYSMKDTFTPTLALAISTVVNFIGNVIGIYFWGVYGIPGSTVVSGIALTFLCFWFLRTKYNIFFYTGNFFNFLGRFFVQILIASTFFVIGYFSFLRFVKNFGLDLFFSEQWGFWILVFALASLVALFVFFSRKLFGLRVYFLSR